MFLIARELFHAPPAKLPMKFRDVFWTENPTFSALRSLVVPRLLRLMHCSLMNTLSFSTTGIHRIQPYFDAPEKGALCVLWHDHTLIPLHAFQHCGIATMMSRSRTGRVQAALWALYGWPIIWGSTKKKEGIAALRETLRTLSNGGLVGFTPDGPKGPRREAHGGVVYLASKSGAPIMPLTYAADRAWRLKSWDRYLIPKPFARVHIHLGEPLWVPSDLSREESLAWQERIKAALDAAEAVAMEELKRRAGKDAPAKAKKVAALG